MKETNIEISKMKHNIERKKLKYVKILIINTTEIELCLFNIGRQYFKKWRAFGYESCIPPPPSLFVCVFSLSLPPTSSLSIPVCAYVSGIL